LIGILTTRYFVADVVMNWWR